jgi:alkylation response protein AidB-like acyl-CoA dehydrogenase
VVSASEEGRGATQGDSGAITAAELASVARRVLAERSDLRDSVKLGASAASASSWRSAAQLGWTMLTIPERRGGLGQGFSALAALYIELGRRLSSLPLSNAMLVVEALQQAADASSGEVLRAIASGDAVFAAPAGVATALQARESGGTLRLDGVTSGALGPERATHVLAIARLRDEPLVVVLPILSLGVVAEKRATWDLSREIADLRFHNVAVDDGALACRGADAQAAWRRLTAHFNLSIACDSLGGAEAILETTVEYAKLRQQFGRPIGSFQAIKHRCADMKTWLEAARALVERAVAQFEASPETAPLAAASKAYAAQIYRRIAMEAVQIHGGVGFTWEHNCHLFLKRALLNEQLGGAPEDQYDAVFATLLENPSNWR